MHNQKITFDQILDTIVDKNSISKTFARTLIKELTALIQEGLLKDESVNLAGFGIFKLHQVPERNGRNIQNGQPIKIPAHRKVLFKPEKHIRELINKKYEDLQAVIPGIGKSPVKTESEKTATIKTDTKPEIKTEAKPETKKTKDPTESEITLSAIAKSLDSMIKDEPRKRTADELSDEPVLKDDIMGLEQKEKENAKMFEDEDRSNKKKLYIGASLIALLLILLLFMQFGGDEPDEVEIVENDKPAVETVSQKQEKTPAPAVQKNEQKAAIKYETVTSVKGDNLWDLAYRHYNDGYLWPLILQANKDQISNPDLIEPGEKLKIPMLSNAKNLNKAENKMLSDGHLTAYFDYRDKKESEALNHLFVADRYDHENVKKSLTKIDNSDYESIKSLSMK